MTTCRSELAVPANDRKKVEKAVASAADLVFLDLEDAVAPSEKAAARGQVVAAIQELNWGTKPRAYRINPVSSPHAYRDIIEVVEGSEGAVDLIVVPKVEGRDQVAFVATLLDQIEAAHGLTRPIHIEAQIETARGLLACEEIAKGDRVEGLTFGPGDFAASIGMPARAIGVEDEWDRRYPGHRFGYAMSRIVTAAHAAGIRATDGPTAEFRDLEALRRSCEIGRSLGFDGKWCIHPAQIETVNDVFSPSADDLHHAHELVAAYEAARGAGRGVATFNGQMIDAASLRMAQRTLAMRDEERESRAPGLRQLTPR
jgi:citrate lyase beta subunit